MNSKTTTPQCLECKYGIQEDLLHCEMYCEDTKPQYVMDAKKECPSFSSKEEMKMKFPDPEEQKLYGAIFGFIVGDMLGVPVEFSSRKERELDEVKELRAYGTYHQPFGTWSDDSSLMLSLIDTYNNGFSLEKLANNFVKYYTDAYLTPNHEVFDIGMATQNAIGKIMVGMEPTQCGGTSERDNGNGSLMRILPLAFVRNSMDRNQYVTLIEEISALTHAHKRSKLACILYVELAAQLVMGCDKMKAYKHAIDFVNEYCENYYSEEFSNFERILSREIISLEKEQIRSTGYVIDTLEAVIWLFLNMDSYEEMVLAAVNLGGDTDTIAAIVGGLAGIYYGLDAIPNNWIQCVRRKDDIRKMIKEFGKKSGSV